MKLIAAHARQHLAQLSHDPTLATIEENDALTEILDGHRLAVKGADLSKEGVAPSALM